LKSQPGFCQNGVAVTNGNRGYYPREVRSQSRERSLFSSRLNRVAAFETAT
jgi:hypothetical protein